MKLRRKGFLSSVTNRDFLLVHAFLSDGPLPHGRRRPRSSSGLAAHFVGGNVTVDNNLKVTGTQRSGVGAFSSSVIGSPVVIAEGLYGADGMTATSDTGAGDTGASGSVYGVYDQSGDNTAPMLRSKAETLPAAAWPACLMAMSW